MKTFKIGAAIGNLKKISIFLLLSTLLMASSAQAALRTKQNLPEFLNQKGWLNSDHALTRQEIQGRVALIHFWNYTSLECVRSVEILNRWHDKYSSYGVPIISVHVPEWGFEKDSLNIQKAVQQLGIKYPVALDTELTLSQLYSNHVQPSFYLIDSRGRIRYRLRGEIWLKRIEGLMVDLLREAGTQVSVQVDTFESKTDPTQIQIPKIEFGYPRVSHFGNVTRMRADSTQKFEIPAETLPNLFYLEGAWSTHPEFIRTAGAGNRILIRYHAKQVHMVLGTLNPRPLTLEIRVDDQPLKKQDATQDLTYKGEKSYMAVSVYRLYSLIDSKKGYADHTLELKTEEPGLDAFAVVFA